MSESITSGDIIERLVQQAGIRKKLATELLRAIPEIIEEALKTDGEVKVKGLGTFRMKWTGARVGRNPKTGERVDIPAHSRLVFIPEQSFKDFIDQDNRLLSYKVIPESQQTSEISNQQPDESRQSSVVSRQLADSSHGTLEPWNPGTTTPEPETRNTQPETRKKRIHWIVPTAIAVIIVLCVAFYFRNFYPVGGQRSAVGGQRSAVGGQRSAVDSQQLAVDSLQLAVDSLQPAVVSQQSTDSTQNLKLITPNPEPKTQNSKLTSSTSGQHLFQLAREQYGNPFLWVLIYRANPDKITNPDMVISGREIVIPELEGKPDKLSHNDSLAVSDGYRLVYEYYKAHGDARADDFRRGIDRYKPK